MPSQKRISELADAVFNYLFEDSAYKDRYELKWSMVYDSDDFEHLMGRIEQILIEELPKINGKTDYMDHA